MVFEIILIRHLLNLKMPLCVPLLALAVFLGSRDYVSPQNATNEVQEGSCLANDGGFSRFCLYHKILYLTRNLPFLPHLHGNLKLGPLELVKLPGNSQEITSMMEGEEPRSHSLFSILTSIAQKGVDYFLDAYGIKIKIGEYSKNQPGIVVEGEVADDAGRKRKDKQKYALVFPILATLKFLVIKAILIPILLSTVVMKKILIAGAMLMPVMLSMMRFCRVIPGAGGPGFGFGGGGGFFPPGLGPLLSPYVASSDAIVGDFSSYSHMASPAQTPYYNKQDYGGRSGTYTPI